MEDKIIEYKNAYKRLNSEYKYASLDGVYKDLDLIGEYIKYLEGLHFEDSVEICTLEKRLKHLLKSDVIREYDEKDIATGEYVRDINDLDKFVAKVLK